MKLFKLTRTILIKKGKLLSQLEVVFLADELSSLEYLDPMHEMCRLSWNRTLYCESLSNIYDNLDVTT